MLYRLSSRKFEKMMPAPLKPENADRRSDDYLKMKRYEAFIFVTGAVTLSLEVLASRIMTPYFGVSLFIWSGILSITLTFLAAGYYFGYHHQPRRECIAPQTRKYPVHCARARGVK